MNWTTCFNQASMPIKAVEGHYPGSLGRHIWYTIHPGFARNPYEATDVRFDRAPALDSTLAIVLATRYQGK